MIAKINIRILDIGKNTLFEQIYSYDWHPYNAIDNLYSHVSPDVNSIYRFIINGSTTF